MANSQRTVLRLQHLMRLQHVDRARPGAQLGVGEGGRNDRNLVWVCARSVVSNQSGWRLSRCLYLDPQQLHISPDTASKGSDASLCRGRERVGEWWMRVMRARGEEAAREASLHWCWHKVTFAQKYGAIPAMPCAHEAV